jgi:hypothetical protein
MSIILLLSTACRLHIDFMWLNMVSRQNMWTYSNNVNIVRAFLESRTTVEQSSAIFTPFDNQQQTCMWNLNRCSTGSLILNRIHVYWQLEFVLELTWTLIVSLQRFNRSLTLLRQTLTNNALFDVQLLVYNSSSSRLQFDLSLPYNRARLRTYIDEFPYETQLYIDVVYRSPSSLAVVLFGQLMHSTTIPTIVRETSSISTLALTTFVDFRSISWTYDRLLSGRFSTF